MSTGAQSFFADMENEADGECAHVPGLKKKKWIWGLEFKSCILYFAQFVADSIEGLVNVIVNVCV